MPAKKNKSARRKQKDRQWIAKQEMLKRDQELAPKLRQPCKYFQSGYCVHVSPCGVSVAESVYKIYLLCGHGFRISF